MATWYYYNWYDWGALLCSIQPTLKQMEFDDALSAAFSYIAAFQWEPDMDGFGPFTEIA